MRFARRRPDAAVNVSPAAQHKAAGQARS
jgi:hypothetical protein